MVEGRYGGREYELVLDAVRDREEGIVERGKEGMVERGLAEWQGIKGGSLTLNVDWDTNQR